MGWSSDFRRQAAWPPGGVPRGQPFPPSTRRANGPSAPNPTNKRVVKSTTAAAPPSSTSRRARTRSAGRRCPATPFATMRCGSSCTRSPTISPTSCGGFALPEEVEHWLLITLRDKLVKIGARVVRPGAATSCSSWPKWRCRERCLPRFCVGSRGSGRGRFRHDGEASLSILPQERCVQDSSLGTSIPWSAAIKGGLGAARSASYHSSGVQELATTSH